MSKAHEPNEPKPAPEKEPPSRKPEEKDPPGKSPPEKEPPGGKTPLDAPTDPDTARKGQIKFR